MRIVNVRLPAHCTLRLNGGEDENEILNAVLCGPLCSLCLRVKIVIGEHEERRRKLCNSK